MKKYCIVFVMFLSLIFAGNTTLALDDAKPVMHPLKLEQKNELNPQYGNFQEEYNQNTQDTSDFKNILSAPKQHDKREKSVFEIFTNLIFVIILIFITAWIYMRIKKINPQQLLEGKFNNLSENTFKILSSMSLGGGKNIYLIEINSTQLIVGTTPQNVSLLAQMDKVTPKIDKEISQECIEKLFQDKTEEFKKLEE